MLDLIALDESRGAHTDDWTRSDNGGIAFAWNEDVRA